MIFIFLATLFLFNLIDSKFFDNKYSAFINIFGGIFSLSFLFIDAESQVPVLNTVRFDKFIVVSYIVIKASFNLYNLINNKENVPYKNWEFGALILFSLNSLFIKGFILLLGFTPNIFIKKENLILSKVDLIGAMLTILAILKFEYQHEVITLLVFSLLPIILLVSLTKITKAKLLMLISFLVMSNHISVSFSIGLGLMIFMFILLESATGNLKELITVRLKKIKIVERILINAKFKINKNKNLYISENFSKKIEKKTISFKNTNLVDELYEIKFVGAFSCFVLLVIVLGLGLVNGL